MRLERVETFLNLSQALPLRVGLAFLDGDEIVGRVYQLRD
jgi:hypothetical protein